MVLWCYGVVVLSLVLSLVLVRIVECWVFSVESWVLSVECWLLTADCRMHIVGHELRFGKHRRAKHCLLWWHQAIERFCDNSPSPEPNIIDALLRSRPPGRQICWFRMTSRKLPGSLSCQKRWAVIWNQHRWPPRDGRISLDIYQSPQMLSPHIFPIFPRFIDYQVPCKIAIHHWQLNCGEEACH
jgi:hypothetical protein